MRKVIVSLLFATICLSFVACNDKNITSDETIEPVVTSEIIEITTDNWQEYFAIDFKADFVTNPFGEIDSVAAGYCISIKPEYQERLLTAEVHFDLKAQNGSSRIYKYDLSSMTYCTEPSGAGASASTSFGSSICTYKYNSNNDKHYTMIEIDSPIDTDGQYKVQIVDSTATWFGIEWEKITVDRVVGSITLINQ